MTRLTRQSPEVFVQALIDWRDSMHLTQKEVAYELGVSSSRYGNWERGIAFPDKRPMRDLYLESEGVIHPNLMLTAIETGKPVTDDAMPSYFHWTNGNHALHTYRMEHNLTMSQLSKRLELHKNTVWRWCQQALVPQIHHLQLVYEATGGLVTPNSFYLRHLKEFDNAQT